MQLEQAAVALLFTNRTFHEGREGHVRFPFWWFRVFGVGSTGSVGEAHGRQGAGVSVY